MPLFILAALAAPLVAAASPVADTAACDQFLESCRAYIVDGRPSLAVVCLDEHAEACPDDQSAEVARAMADLAAAMAAAGPAAAEVAENEEVEAELPSQEASPEAEPAREPISVSELMLSGMPELVLTSTLYGGFSGFWASAGALSALRTPTMASLPALIAAPALGALGGLAASSVAAWQLQPSPGDAALISSSMVLGTAYGVVLQFAMFDAPFNSAAIDPARRAPWRFVTILATSAAATGTAAAVAPYLDVDPGDVGLANSAALWGAVLPLLSMFILSVDFGNDIAPMVLVTGSSIAAYDLVLALSPVIDVPRPATWLVEVGGVLGLLTGVAVLPLWGSMGNSQVSAMTVVTGATALGVSAGAVSCFLLAEFMRRQEPRLASLPMPLVMPTLLPDPGHPERTPAVGLALGGRF